MNKIIDFFNYTIHLGSDISFTVKSLVIIVLVFFFTKYFLRFSRRLILKRLDEDVQFKFKSIFAFFNYFVYLIVILITFDTIGVNVTAIFAASAALLVGVGLALQTFIQDIISGIFIIADKAVHVGDIIAIEGQVGRVENITLRTTRAVTIDNKVLIIPNHKFLTSILYNWTENGTLTREHVEVGVSYASDVNQVEEILIELAGSHDQVLKNPVPTVLFQDFGDSALSFRLYFSINNSFIANQVKSDIRFKIFQAFKDHNIQIPFPQRTVWLNQTENL
ncbi:mechanosensitive ion channel [Flavobacteriaceae bacterium]|jgi:small-conductance mechanosensitive channel|nr:mechanosensitive ion channel [Flavobacteriaceae bacterium]